MSSLSKVFSAKGPLSFVLLVLAAVMLVVGVVEAATTISTNISTGGTLSVTGATTLNGNTTLGNAATDVNLFTGTLQASTTALFTSGFTTYGNSTFGDAATDTNIFTGTLQASTTALFTGAVTMYGNLTVDKSATTTVTFSDEGINFDANTFVIDPNANRVGILTATPSAAFEVSGLASSTTAVVGGGDTISGIVFGTCTYNPGAAITASSTLSTNCTAASGVRTGDRVFVTPRSLETELIMVSASSTAQNVIQVTVYNTGAITGSISPASATWDWMSIR
jgi:ethanolamine utilization microcompartment shell protein EutS